MEYEIVNKDEFFEKLKKRKNIDYDLIHKAYEISQKAHKGQFRESGEEFIIHPINVANILLDMDMDSCSIITGLLHDVVEDTEINLDTIEIDFGHEIALLVDGMTKIMHLENQSIPSYETKQAENFRKLLFSITKDIRLVIIKLVDRLHNIRTLCSLDKERQLKIAKETMDIFVPLANRFGLAKIKWELEDICFKYLHEKEYYKIKKIISVKKKDRDKHIQEFMTELKNYLSSCKINFEIIGRTKHFYSIYRKKFFRGIPYEDIFDLAAVRIIVGSKETCYKILGLIHHKFPFINERIKDYIANPKPNGYQSLHTVIINDKGKKVEIQIRTRKMHYIAEEGVAAHWKYKEFNKSSNLKENVQKKYETQIMKIRKLLNKSDHEDSSDFLDNLKLDLYPQIIVVISPDGKLIDLPKHSTPVDFAFAIHSEVGLRCEGAKVNSSMVPIDHILKSGDKVEILTSNQPKPSKDWLDFIKSSKARKKLGAYLRKKEREDALKLGKKIFKKKCSKKSIKLSDEEYASLMKKFGYENETLFLSALGRSDIDFSDIENALKEETAVIEKKQTISPDNWLKGLRTNVEGIRIDEIDNLMFHYAKCCNPIPGDEIIGYTTRGHGITIHKLNCKNVNFRKLVEKFSNRLIPLEWNFKDIKDYTYKIKLRSTGRRKFFLDILKIMSKYNLTIIDSSMKQIQNSQVCNFTISVNNEKSFNKLIYEIKSIEKNIVVTKLE